MIKLTWGQGFVLALAALPMVAVGAAGAVATYVNMDNVLHRSASALGLVAAGEGATLICALVALAVTLMGQHTPAAVRTGLWLIPLTASGAGIALAPTSAEAITMGFTPMAMTAAGEGIAFVARRVVAYRTGTDIEQQRRSGLLLWHANRAANGSRIGQRVSRMAVWRLTKQFAATDGQLSVQLGEIQRYRIGESADANLAAALTKTSERPAAAPVPPAPALPPAAPSQAVSEHVVTSLARFKGEPAPDEQGEDGYEWIQGVLSEGEARVMSDPGVKLLSVAEVAALKKVATGTVRSWKHRGQLRVHDVVDGKPMFHPNDVAQLD